MHCAGCGSSMLCCALVLGVRRHIVTVLCMQGKTWLDVKPSARVTIDP